MRKSRARAEGASASMVVTVERETERICGRDATVLIGRPAESSQSVWTRSGKSFGAGFSKFTTTRNRPSGSAVTDGSETLRLLRTTGVAITRGSVGAGGGGAAQAAKPSAASRTACLTAVGPAP
jgi:hypothetical protein